MTGKFSIRSARADDIPALDDVLYRAFDTCLRADYPAKVLDRAVPMMGRARPELVETGTYFVATDGAGRILGAGGWTATPPHGGHAEGQVGNIRHFGVDPDFGGRGIASAIMAHVVRDAKARGVKRMDCLSTRSAVGFYRSTGFEVTGAQDVVLGEGVVFPAIEMVRLMP